MQILKTPSSKQSTPIPRGLIWSFIVISFLGFLDAVFLTAEHYLGPFLACPLFGDCGKVTTSPYSAVLGVPVALVGAIYYLAIFLLGIAYLDTKQTRPLNIAIFLTPFGFFASLWFLYLQILVIKALCFYCLLSLLTSTLLFVLGLLLHRKIAVSTPGLLK